MISFKNSAKISSFVKLPAFHLAVNVKVVGAAAAAIVVTALLSPSIHPSNVNPAFTGTGN